MPLESGEATSKFPTQENRKTKTILANAAKILCQSVDWRYLYEMRV